MPSPSESNLKSNSSKKKKPKTSFVRKYFDQLENNVNEYKCKICLNIVKGSNTSNRRKHLRLNHTLVYDHEEKELQKQQSQIKTITKSNGENSSVSNQTNQRRRIRRNGLESDSDHEPESDENLVDEPNEPQEREIGTITNLNQSTTEEPTNMTSTNIIEIIDFENPYLNVSTKRKSMADRSTIAMTRSSVPADTSISSISNQSISFTSSDSELSSSSGHRGRTLHSANSSSSSNSKSSSESSSSAPRIFHSSVPQFTLDDMCSNIHSVKRGGRKWREYNNAMLYMIVKDNLPLRTPEKEGFKRYTHALAPMYEIPNKDTITNLLDGKYESLFPIFKDKLKNKDISLTSDLWTESHNSTSILGMTAHYVDDNDDLCRTVLGGFEMENHHTAENILAKFKAILQEWEIPVQKVVAMITDGAANIVNAATSLVGKEKHLHCATHCLHLVVMRTLKAMVPVSPFRTNNSNLQPKEHEDTIVEEDNYAFLEVDDFPTGEYTITNTIRKVKNIAKWFRQSNNASYSLKNLEDLRTLQSVSTRWNSTYYMLHRFIKLHGSINSILLQTPNAPDIVKSEEISLIEEILPMLAVFEEATRRLSADTHSTMSTLLSEVSYIQHSLDNKFGELSKKAKPSKQAEKFKRILTTELNSRFLTVEKHFLPAIAAILDPRFKKNFFKDPINVSKAVQWIKRIFDQEKESETNALNSRQPTENQQKLPPKPMSEYERFIAQTTGTAPSEEFELTGSVVAHNQLTDYLRSETVPLEFDPLMFWKLEKNSKYRFLYPIAKMYLSIPASSSSCERLFSDAGDIQRKKRNKIIDQTFTSHTGFKNFFMERMAGLLIK